MDAARCVPIPALHALQISPEILRRLAYRWPDRYPVLLDSATSSGQGRWSILMMHAGPALYAAADGSVRGAGLEPTGRDFLEAFDQWWREIALPEGSAATLPFTGGWALYLGYELANDIEATLDLPLAARGLRAAALRTPAGLLYDHHEHRCHAVAEPGRETLITQLHADVATILAGPDTTDFRPFGPLTLDEEEPARFRNAVLRAQQHIRDGDIYQANLSRLWTCKTPPALELPRLYERLRQQNPAPFAAWARLPGLDVLSSSPERLVRVREGQIETRPIAGTRARSRGTGRDDVETQALLANAKEQAEHVMLIDLERNDLGRLCRAGSVHVGEYMIAESYEHVHHIVSNVEGTLRSGVTPAEVIRAVFPGGTITGCPKVRCMQIIGEIERAPRGAYTGSLGYVNRDGSMDLNILIRTITHEDGLLGFRAGAGIVADSDPERELEETRAKARGLLAALGMGP